MADSPILPNSIPALAPVSVVPKHPTQAAAALGFLDTIDVIEINHTVERDGVIYFVLDVFLKHYKSRIPTVKFTEKQLHQHPCHPISTTTNSNAADSMPTTPTKYCKDEPDYQLEKRFSDFANLRYSIWVYAQKENECKCAYCEAFLDYIVYSMAQPRLLVKLATTTDMRKKLFTTFCNEFLQFTVSDKRDAARSDCEVLQAIPVLMERFFRKKEGSD